MLNINWEYLLTNLVYRRISVPIAKRMSKRQISPNFVTILAFIVGLTSAITIFYNIVLSVVLIFISQILDCVDGDLARISGKTSARGAYLDRLFDRFVDFALIFSISAYSKLWIEGFFALFATLSVSMARLMAEKEGLTCKVGIAGRDTRILIIMLGLLFSNFGGILLSLWLLIILGFITTIQRIAVTLRNLD
ncbi:MAG: CDP-diacylglycerol---glycerol-3-phosphate 3-phosphatidyltransferase [Archaeoglobaceae archaeon]|nr:CDP-diacylglycerol---glycerol-3-phosphate 3-phosphatidyltransferase [Archaeoglobaceae archaeon]MDK2875707.1 CDP-diacylglycerol---glycerol-3-phosphate 3-phosphatidyltransferase [Archaeoglobaceae archaeon]